MLGGLFVATAGLAWVRGYHGQWKTKVGFASDQPVLFSHRHHVGELHIDCRFCHVTAETSAFAGLPPTRTCLVCHSQIFTETAMLRPVVRSAATGQPLQWNRVNALPDHVFFNHSIHVAKGVGCTTCHGAIGDMALTMPGQALEMRWCISCHQNPGPRLRPASDVFSGAAPPAENSPQRSRELVAFYQVHTAHLINCSSCHH